MPGCRSKPSTRYIRSCAWQTGSPSRADWCGPKCRSPLTPLNSAKSSMRMGISPWQAMRLLLVGAPLDAGARRFGFVLALQPVVKIFPGLPARDAVAFLQLAEKLVFFTADDLKIM